MPFDYGRAGSSPDAWAAERDRYNLELEIKRFERMAISSKSVSEFELYTEALEKAHRRYYNALMRRNGMF